MLRLAVLRAMVVRAVEVRGVEWSAGLKFEVSFLLDLMNGVKNFL
jgi:hypothetical protein